MSLIPHCFGETFVSLWSVLVLGSTTSAFARRFRESAFWPTVGQCAIVLRHLRRTARIYEDVLFSDYDTHSALPLSLKKILELLRKFAVFGRMLPKLVIFRIPSFESIFTSRRCRESSIPGLQPKRIALWLEAVKSSGSSLLGVLLAREQ
jgi:hypothetical protein